MWSPEIVELLYPGRSPYHVEVFEMIMWSLIPLAGIFIYGTFLTAAGDLKYLNTIALFAVVLNIILNANLIPDLKAYGSALATLITQVFVFVAHYSLCLKKYWRV
jgi:Na+-driven multidrug efflux pump